MIMSMLIQFQIILLSFQSVWLHQLTGESDVVFMSAHLTYCAAHQNCFNWGRSKGRIGYMIGENYKNIFQYCNCSQHLWVNINSLLHPRNYSRVRRWSYGEKVPKLDGFEIDNFRANYTTMSYSTLIYTPKETFVHVNTLNSTYAHVCQIGRLIGRKSGIRRELFRTELLSHGKLVAHSDQTVGCLTKTTEPTTAGCALRCHQNLICRSFYYNKKLETCIITEYVDSLLSPASWNLAPFTWSRFSRLEWSFVEV
ncbi:hypothetical protein D915_007282 [Fasciola hepatica]|uniref:Apple domain-containing protein n=1 Tax=Fasciola hepatica TaxID=6192 RepID=A0A4E0R3J8_FASHE|nr:hypothetical protein D915_007282 [Fasciola hepatica]